MSLACADDGFDEYVEFSDSLITSAAPCKCLECHKEVPAFEPFYMVRNWRFANDDDYEEGLLSEDEEEVEVANKPCCEECGDLAMSFLDLGYCWDTGSLRADIAELASMELANML